MAAAAGNTMGASNFCNFAAGVGGWLKNEAQNLLNKPAGPLNLPESRAVKLNHRPTRRREQVRKAAAVGADIAGDGTVAEVVADIAEGAVVLL